VLGAGCWELGVGTSATLWLTRMPPRALRLLPRPPNIRLRILLLLGGPKQPICQCNAKCNSEQINWKHNCLSPTEKCFPFSPAVVCHFPTHPLGPTIFHPPSIHNLFAQSSNGVEICFALTANFNTVLRSSPNCYTPLIRSSSIARLGTVDPKHWKLWKKYKYHQIF